MTYQPAQGDFVPGEQHRYVLTNFRIAHEKVEQQRQQLQEQEKQVALLQARIASLEGRQEVTTIGSVSKNQGGTSVDDWSIKSTASKLEKLINRWAADVIRTPPCSLEQLADAALSDIQGRPMKEHNTGLPIFVQNILRHAMAEMISEGVINCLIVTSSSEANVQLTRIHEHLFARDPTVAGVWRRQTFSAAVDAFSPAMSLQLLEETMPALAALFTSPPPEHALSQPIAQLLDEAYGFSRMLHGSNAGGSSSADSFYRAFVPELGSVLYPRQVELIKRCMKSESGQVDYVGATIFPGLVKVSKGAAGADGKADILQTVVRRAQVICACALIPRVGSSPVPQGMTMSNAGQGY